MKKIDFTPPEIEQIILMAWADTISFETLYREFGLTKNEAISKVSFRRQNLMFEIPIYLV